MSEFAIAMVKTGSPVIAPTSAISAATVFNLAADMPVATTATLFAAVAAPIRVLISSDDCAFVSVKLEMPSDLTFTILLAILPKSVRSILAAFTVAAVALDRRFESSVDDWASSTDRLVIISILPIELLKLVSLSS